MSDVRYARPRARQEPGLLADRHRRADARHRPERRGLHDAQGHRAQPDRRRRQARRSSPSSSPKRAPDGRCASRIPTTSTFAITSARSPGCSARRDHGQPGPRPRRPPGLGRARHGQLLPGARRARRSAAARCCRPTRSRPGAIPVVVISDGLWRRDFGADPDIVGKTIEINNNPLTVVGVADPAFHGTIVIYDVEVFIPVMMAPQLGFTFGSQQTTPAGILDRSPRGRLLSAGLSAARHDARERGRAQADALWAALSRERPLRRSPSAAEGRPGSGRRRAAPRRSSCRR